MFQSLIILDKSITNTINGLRGLNPVLDIFGLFVSEYLIFIIGIVAGAWVFAQRKRLLWLVSIALAAALSQLGKLVIASFYFRSRPGVEHLFNSIPYDASFPSGHTAGAFALAFAILILSRWRSSLGWVLFTLSFFVAFGRIFEGRHYASDTIGGFVLGFIVAWIGVKGVQKIQLLISNN